MTSRRRKSGTAPGLRAPPPGPVPGYAGRPVLRPRPALDARLPPLRYGGWADHGRNGSPPGRTAGRTNALPPPVPWPPPLYRHRAPATARHRLPAARAEHNVPAARQGPPRRTVRAEGAGAPPDPAVGPPVSPHGTVMKR